MALSPLSPPDISDTIIHTSFESVLHRSLSYMCYKPLLFLKMLIKQRIDVFKEWWGTQWHFLRMHHDNGDGASSQHGRCVLRRQDSPELQAQHGGVYGQCANYVQNSLVVFRQGIFPIANSHTQTKPLTNMLHSLACKFMFTFVLCAFMIPQITFEKEVLLEVLYSAICDKTIILTQI